MPTILEAGDIGFTRIQTTQPSSANADVFAFVTLVDLDAGTTIFFTDNGWLNTGAFRTGEGTIRWDSGAAAIEAGTVITLAGPLAGTSGNWRGNGGASDGTTGLDSASIGTWTALNVGGTAAIAGGNGMDMSNSGDGIIAYQATDPNAPTALIAAINNRAFSSTNDSNNSAVPGTGTATTDDDLPLGESSVQITAGGTQVYGSYNGPTTGTADELRVALNTTANWTVSNTTPGTGPSSFTVGEPPDGETVSIADATITEGDAGTSLLTFTVTRSGNLGAFTVDFTTADGSALAGSDYLAATGTVTFDAGGDLSETFTIEIVGDTEVEQAETFAVTLGNLVDTAGTTTIADGNATGTITDNDVGFTAIYTLQGIGHRAPVVGGTVTSGSSTAAARFNVEGVITAIAQNGFYMQDATGDADDRTSDGIFVFTGSNAAILSTLTVGNTMQVLNVQVGEFSANSNNLSGTQLSATSSSGATFNNLGGSTTLDAVVIGVERFIPTGQVSDPGYVTYDITTDAADFWESLEGMLVEIPESIATSPTSAFRSRDPINSSVQGPDNNEIWVQVPANTAPGGIASNGGFLLTPTDVNPERIQLDDIRTPIDFPDVTVGDVIGPIQGVVNYDFQNYEVLVSTSPVVVTESTIEKQTTDLAADARRITIGTYNVENLDPEIEDTAAGSVSGSDLYVRQGESDDDIGSGQYGKIVDHITINMGAPTIVALQEVQDNDGAEISSVVDSGETLQVLVDLIFAETGIRYAFAYENPPTGNIDGGQPNANIRPAFLYRADQVTLVDTIRIGDDAGSVFQASRKPLVGIFDFNGVEFTVINNHFNSKGGDNAIYGNVQPPVLSSEIQRILQAEFVRDYAEGLLAADPDARIMVLGDLNDFAWSNPNQVLTGDGLFTDLAEALLPEADRFSYNFQGNAQSLDHTLVTETLLNDAAAEHDIVRVNSEYSDQASDHDPAVTLLDFTAFGERLRLTGGTDTVDGGGGDDRIIARAGPDVITGGDGDDTLVGGAGRDTFIYGTDDGFDRITDYQVGFDRIDLTAFAAFGVDGIEDVDISGNANAAFVRLEFDGVTEIRLVGVAAGSLTNADFVFG